MYKSSYTGSQIDEAVAKANEAAPQSTTYTKNEVDSALSGKQATLVVGTNLDSAPTENSTNPVTSGGVYQALSAKMNVGQSFSNIDANDITTGGIYTVGASSTNLPFSGARAFMIVINAGETDTMQICQKLTVPGSVYIRQRSWQSVSPYYKWSAWYKYDGVVST